MVVFKKISDLTHFLAQQDVFGHSIGFVPTMGALHEGHISLVQASKTIAGVTVCSIFLNPTQFNNPEDLAKYPVSTDADILLLTMAGCDVLFLPDANEIYPNGVDSIPSYQFGKLETILEGAMRPGHFRGVGQVVARLLQIVAPNHLFLGQKDFQQCLVIRKLLQIMPASDSFMPVDVMLHFCPTLREPDGLAKSSRNRRLSEGQRALAGLIYQCLVSIQAKQQDADFELLRKECDALLREKGLEPEYIALANAEDLELLPNFNPGTPMVVLIAAWLGKVRLIDNLML